MTFQGHLVANDVSHSFRAGRTVEVLRSITLEIRGQEILAVVGPSGCGKSTLLNILAGFIVPDRGSVTLDGRPLIGPGPERGVVFQNYSLFPWKTVRGNIEFGMRMLGLDRSLRAARGMEILQAVHLLGFENSFPAELSGGMAQRVGIARMLATDPAVMLMDEPFGSLDAQTRGEMQSLFLNIWNTHRKGVLFVTHDIDEAILLADRIVVLSNRPANVHEEFTVPLPRPRQESMLFWRETLELRQCLHELLRSLLRTARV